MNKLIKLNNNDHELIRIKASGLSQVIMDIPTKSVAKKIDVVLEKEGAEVEILGTYVGRGDQKIELEINAIHKVPNTKCLTQIRGVLKDQSFSSFKGMIKIEKPAQKTNSYLDDDVLILGDGARNQSEPTLEIEADDVKATHGATTGRIPEEQIFYLQSRGLAQEEAENLVVEGFLSSVVSKINDAKIRGKMSSDLSKRLVQ